MITKIQLAAMGRVDIPEDERRDFYLYVDEFQNSQRNRLEIFFPKRGNIGSI